MAGRELGEDGGGGSGGGFAEGLVGLGLEVDLARALARTMGVEANLVTMPFKELLPALERGDIDAIFSGVTMTAERNLKVAFAGPYPGQIVPIDLAEIEGDLLCQKDAFLCAARGTEISIAFTKRLGAGFFGGEGFADLATYFEATGPLDFVFGDGISKFERGTSVEVAEDQLGEDVEGIAGSGQFANTFDAAAVRGLTFLLGGDAGDTFIGGSGTDQFVGLDGNDVMIGNAGIDALTGGDGNDDLTGGEDLDVFFFDGADGDDIIRDFAVGEDLIFFTGTLITGLDQLTFSTIDGDGDFRADDGLISYSAGGEDSSIIVVDVDGTVLESTAGIFNLT